VNSAKASFKQNPWRWALWTSLTFVTLAVFSLAPFLTSSTELVRMRNALLLDDRFDAAQDWAPPTFPPDFKREQAAPYPAFVNTVQQLGLPAQTNDWEVAIAISKHLLGSSPELSGGAIQSDLTDTYRRIVKNGEGYCGDFVRVFTAIAEAAGLTTRSWAFSFDGFGGHGHIWLEIWNRQVQAWQLMDVFDNYYFVLENDKPLSALEVHQALKRRPNVLHLKPLYDKARLGYVIETKAWDYFLRGQTEWYQLRGTNVYSYDNNKLVKSLGTFSRSLEQLGGIAAGVSPRLVVLSEAGNRSAYGALRRLRWQLYGVMVIVPLGLISALLCWIQLRFQRRRGGSASIHV
jgi:hypothetical protein